ncbi:MAG: hypothetical protein K9J37_17155 [Saprospiraceae bacterium]|nr:hypothetical protein [Saprospiraceae bacterium]MCF8251646.1 hypothetical protein [Saprospiraceae bacterium]MCF8281056.1 hypothetical protein [Bacteroidales bacterium]MCF8313265.1 hypothetical protein [Saprospiraceae bacterium]MCF8442009.1 hypothetical protein [Saprospiraceae bacterium]
MKKYLLWAALLLTCSHAFAQSYTKVESGYIKFGDATIVIEDSDVQFLGNVDAGTSTVILAGAMDVEITCAGNVLHKCGVNKTAGGLVTLQDSLTIIDSLLFLGSSGKVVLGSYNVHFGAVAGVSGFGSSNYFITDGTGQVRKADLGPMPFTFPVGFNPTSYNPVTVTQFGLPDTLGIRCLEHAYNQGCVGTPYVGGVVDASWELTEAIPGDLDVDMAVQWSAGDELSGFDRSFSGNAYYGSSGWDLTVNDCAAAAGPDPYTRERMGITEPGAFAVGNDSVATSVLLDLNLFLQGPYAGGGLMGDALRSASLLPADEPFGGLGFTHYGFGGSESVDPAIFDVTGDDAIVDWVLVEIRSGSDSTIIKSTTPALVQRDGDIVGRDGFSPLVIPGIGEGNYFVVVKHRNHLGVMTANKLALFSTPTAFDFTNDPASTFGGLNGIADLGGGRFGLFSGDFNHNGQVQNTDVTGLLPSLGNAGYLPGDLNLNSQVQNTDLQLSLLPNIGKGVQFPNN